MKAKEFKARDVLLFNAGDVHDTANSGEEDLIIAIFRTNDPGDSGMFWAVETGE